MVNRKADGIYNTAFVFDRNGKEIGAYDKTHLFTPMAEDKYFQKGDHLTFFELDGVRCGIIICYDIRFPELVRSYAVKGLDMLFVVSQWPAVRIPHLLALTKARAIENQMFVVCCNSCGTAGSTVYGGQEYVKTHTAPYKYPRIVEFRDSLPKTISGKIQRSLLREGV